MATFLELLGDPNFQNLLAGVGTQLGGPGSVGAALGSSTIAFNKAQAAQRAAKLTLERNANVTPVAPVAAAPSALDTLVPNTAPSSLNVGVTPITGDPKLSYAVKDPNVLATEVADLLTPPDQAGPTSVARDKAGQVKVSYTPQPLPANEVAGFLSPYLPPQTTLADLDTDYTKPGRFLQQASLDTTNDVLASLGPAQAEARAVEPVVPPAVSKSLDTYAKKHGADSTLAKAILLQESGGSHTNPDGSVKVSSKGARGYMQLMDATARKHNVDSNNPEQNLEGGVREIAYLKTLSSNPKDILAGYVGGENGMRLYQSQQATTPKQKELLADINSYVNSTYARYERMQGQAKVADLTGSTEVTSPGGIAEVPKGTPMSIPNAIYTPPAAKAAPTKPAPGTVEAATPQPTVVNKPPVVKTQAEQLADVLGLPMPEPIVAPKRTEGTTESISVPIEKQSPQLTALAPKAVRESYDLRGLSPDEVDKVVGRSIEAERADIARSVDRRENTQLIETDDGYIVLNKRTRQITPLTKEGKIDAKLNEQLLKHGRLSEFSREMSAVPGTDTVVRGRMNESQSKSFKFGSRALQANEKQRRLEQGNLDDPKKFADERAYMLQTLESLPADVSMGVVGQIVTTGNALVGAAKDAYNNWIAKNPTATEGEITSFLTSLGLGASEARAQAILANRRTLSDDQREFLANSIEFATAMLRDESGAAINAGEFLNTYRKYFPVVGDTTRDLLRKVRTRQQAIRGFRSSAGRPLLPPDVED